MFFRLHRLSEKMQGFHVENGIDGATVPLTSTISYSTVYMFFKASLKFFFFFFFFI